MINKIIKRLMYIWDLYIAPTLINSMKQVAYFKSMKETYKQ